MRGLLELPREIASALFFSAAIAVAAGAVVAGRTQRLAPAMPAALGAFVVAAASFAYAIWRNHRTRRMFGRIRMSGRIPSKRLRPAGP